jgi:hypothetical protein
VFSGLPISAALLRCSILERGDADLCRKEVRVRDIRTKRERPSKQQRTYLIFGHLLALKDFEVHELKFGADEVTGDGYSLYALVTGIILM